MKSFFAKFFNWDDKAAAPQTPIPRSRGNPLPQPESGYPRAYHLINDNALVARPDLFDPALKHFRYGFRKGVPAFSDASVAHRWRTARLRAMYAVLELVNQTIWKDHLVLRGSAVMASWFGESARDAHDLDWIVRPTTLGVDSEDASRMLADLQHLALQTQIDDGRGDIVRFLPGKVAIDDIWIYDRAPGRRLVFPWLVDGLPGGYVQCDIVFGEALPLAPVLTPFRQPGGEGSISLWTASKPMSLAWKLQWLCTDQHPQGKDLYDAVLLAENCSVPADVMHSLLNEDRCDVDVQLSDLFLDRQYLEWDWFVAEYPSITGEVSQWQDRLITALQRPA